MKLYKKNKLQELDQPKNKAMYGFLYLGFLRRKYWWSIVEIIRKVAILLTNVWVNRISIWLQAFVALFIIVLAARLQIGNMPYYKKIINRIEAFSLRISFMTVYIGLWYLSGDIVHEEVKIILFIILIVGNLAFVILWIKAYLSSAAWALKIFKFIKFENQFVDKTPNILLDKMIPQDQD